MQAVWLKEVGNRDVFFSEKLKKFKQDNKMINNNKDHNNKSGADVAECHTWEKFNHQLMCIAEWLSL